MDVIENHPKSALAAALALLLIAAAFAFRSDPIPETVREDVSEIFQNMATQVDMLARVIDKGSSVVLVELDDTYKLHGKARYKPVLAALANAGHRLVAIETLAVDATQGWDEFKAGFPYAAFEAVAAKHPEADAVLALCGEPYSPRGYRAPDPSALPKLLVVSRAGDPVLQSLDIEDQVQAGLVYAATLSETVHEGDALRMKFRLIESE